jgi:hypothetical protein
MSLAFLRGEDLVGGELGDLDCPTTFCPLWDLEDTLEDAFACAAFKWAPFGLPFDFPLPIVVISTCFSK